MMRGLLLLVSVIIPAAAQSPLVRLVNASHPVSTDFEIGDHFQIVISGAPNQSVSVRTTRLGRTDWSPVIGSTDSSGRWTTAGQFEKSDVGDWQETWTIGGKLAGPAIRFSVKAFAPCLPGAQVFVSIFGPNTFLTCDTAEGPRTFAPPSASEPFRTPDGRLVPGRPIQQTQEQYYTEILQYFITGGKETGPPRIALQSSRGGLGDETADLIGTLIGVNALYEDETRNLLAIIHAAFEKPETIQPSAKNPSITLLLLRQVADFTGQDSLKQEIAETIAYVQAR
jgi:hypothetical protein